MPDKNLLFLDTKIFPNNVAFLLQISKDRFLGFQNEDCGKGICLDHCGKNYDTLLGLLNHQSKLELQSDTSNVNKTEKESGNKSKEYKCHFCDVTFITKILYKQHMMVSKSKDKFDSVYAQPKDKPSNLQLRAC